MVETSDEDVEEVHEDVVLDDAYAGDSCAFMLQYVLRDSESYRICLETDKLHTPAAQTPPRITNVSSARAIKETSQSQEKSHRNSHPVVDVEPLPALESMEVSDVIANVPPIVEVVGDQNKETTQSNFSSADTNLYEAEKVTVTSSQQLQELLLEFEVNAIPSVPSCDLYLKAIEEMYPTFGTGRLRSNIAFQEDWATTRAVKP